MLVGFMDVRAPDAEPEIADVTVLARYGVRKRTLCRRKSRRPLGKRRMLERVPSAPPQWWGQAGFPRVMMHTWRVRSLVADSATGGCVFHGDSKIKKISHLRGPILSRK
jgi:hypothetical protein